MYASLTREYYNNSNKKVIGIIFSKDRALQLHALLGSYYDQVKRPQKIYVIYDASNVEHKEAYIDVQAIYRDKELVFLPQKSKNSFRNDLLGLVCNLSANYLFFLVDDIIFIEPVELDSLTAFNPIQYIGSLRMGLNLNYCYPAQKKQKLPIIIEEVFGQEDFFSWCWVDGELDWNYPLSVDGHLFSFHEVKAMLSLSDFKAPNSLESALQQFKFLFLNRKGVAYKKSRIVNIPINKVQLENNNIYGSIHQDVLLQLWNDGMQIDYKSLYGANNISAHEELTITFIKRDINND